MSDLTRHFEEHIAEIDGVPTFQSILRRHGPRAARFLAEEGGRRFEQWWNADEYADHQQLQQAERAARNSQSSSNRSVERSSRSVTQHKSMPKRKSSSSGRKGGSKRVKSNASKFVRDCMKKDPSLSRVRVTEWGATSATTMAGTSPLVSTGVDYGAANANATVVSAAQGNGYNQRVSNSIELKSLSIDGVVRQNNDEQTQASFGRILVVYDKNPPNSTTKPTLDEVLQDTTSLHTKLFATKRIDNKSRFEVLADKRLSLPAGPFDGANNADGNSQQAKRFHIGLHWKSGKKVIFKVNTTTDSTANLEYGNIYIYFMGFNFATHMTADYTMDCMATARFQA